MFTGRIVPVLRLRNNASDLLVSSSLMLSSLIVGAGLAFATSVVIARSLSVDQYGVLSLFLSLQNFIVIFASFGIPRTLAKFIPEHLATNPVKAGQVARVGLSLIVLVSFFVAAVYASLSEFIGSGLYNDPRMTLLVPFSAAVVVTTAILSGVSGLAQGYGNVGVVALIRVASPLVSFGSIVLLLPIYDLQGVFMGYVVGQASTIMISIYVVSARNRTFLSHDGRSGRDTYRSKELLKFSNLSFLANIVIVAGAWVGSSVLALRVSIEAVGYFGIAYGFYVVLILVPAAITVPFLPRISVLSLKSRDEVRFEVERVMRTTAVLTLPFVIALGFSSAIIIESVYGSQYLPATQVVLFMILASYINTNATIVTTAFVGMGKISLYLWMQILWAIAFVTTSVVLIPTCGVAGIGTAYAASYLVLLVESLHVSRRVIALKMGRSVGSVFLGILFISASFFMISQPQIPFVWSCLLASVGSLSTIVLLWGRKTVILESSAGRR